MKNETTMKNTYHVPGCDGDQCCHNEAELRILPTGGDGNAILCRACYDHEMDFRRDRIADGVAFDLPTWTSLKVYTI